MYIVDSSTTNNLNRPTQTKIKAPKPRNELVQDLQLIEFQSPRIGHRTPIFGSVQPEELEMPLDANGPGFRQESMTSIEGSFDWPINMPSGDNELGASPPYCFTNGVLQPFHYDSQRGEPLSWNAEHPHNSSQGMDTLHSPLGSFSQMSQGSWMEPFYPASYSSAGSVNNTENANASFSQMSLVIDSCPRELDTDNHSTAIGQTTRVAHSDASTTEGDFSPCQVGNGSSSVSLNPRETRGGKPSKRKVFRHSLPSSSCRSASSKKEHRFQEAKRPFVEYMFHASSGETAAAGSNKRRRTTDEKQQTALIRELGGACEQCRRKHRRCTLKHHQQYESLPTQNTKKGYSNNPRPTVRRQAGASSPNSQYAYQVASTVLASNSSFAASSPATQHETDEVATPFHVQTCSKDFNHTMWDIAEVGGQFQDTRNIIPERTVSIVRGHGSLGLPGNNFDGIQGGSCPMDEANIDNYQLAANQSPDIFNDIEENLKCYLSLFGDVFEDSTDHPPDTQYNRIQTIATSTVNMGI